MNTQSGVQIAFGSGRSQHVSNISFAAQSWSEYATNHEHTFAEAGQKKYIAFNDSGQIIGAAATLQEMQGNPMFTNANTVRHEDMLTIEAEIQRIRKRKLNGIADLKSAGLTVPADLTKQLIGFEKMPSFKPAKREMNPKTFNNNDTTFSEIYVPLPIAHSTFSVPFRQGFAYKNSLGLQENTRMVFESDERMLFKGDTTIKISLNDTLHSIHGYTTHPYRGQSTISDWTDTTKTDLIYKEVIQKVNLMFKNQGGVSENSIVLYFPKNFKEVMDRDYISGQVSKTVKQRIMDIPEIKDVKFAEMLDDSEIVLVEMEARTITLAIASDVIAVPHVKTRPMEDQVITTYSAMVPQIKFDDDQNTGIHHCVVA